MFVRKSVFIGQSRGNNETDKGYPGALTPSEYVYIPDSSSSCNCIGLGPISLTGLK